MKAKELPPVELLRETFNYDPETGKVTWKVTLSNAAIAGKEAGSLNRTGYRHIKINKTLYKTHRIVWALVYGEDPIGYDIDHINRIKDDNRLVNLRIATRSENMTNVGLRCDNKSGHTGINWNKNVGKWEARIVIDRVRQTLGYFTDIDDAVAARKEATSSTPTGRVGQGGTGVPPARGVCQSDKCHNPLDRTPSGVPY
jgi:hypothetical protein